MKHTELPWKIAIPTHPGPQQENDRLIYSTDGKHIAETFQYQNHLCPNGPSIENAEFIVRACNSHYDLLEALECAPIPCKAFEGTTYSMWYEKFRNKAVAKAEGK